MIQYVFMGLLVALALLFDLSVWVWLRANPVPPLVEIPDWRVPRPYRALGVNDYQNFTGVQASSAWGVVGATSSFAGRR